MTERLFSNTASRGFATVVDQAIVSGTSFISTVIVARTCPKESLGIYVLGNTILLFVMSLQNAVISMPYIFYGAPEDGVVDAEYLGSTLLQTIGLAVMAIAVVTIAASTFGARAMMTAKVNSAPWILAAILLFALFRESARRIYFAWMLPKSALVMDAVASSIQIGCLIVLAKTGHLTVASAYSSVGAGCAVASFWWLASNSKRVRFRTDRLVTDLNLNWTFGKWILGGSIAYTARSDAYPWFLAGFGGTASTAVFGACMGAVVFINPFFIALSNFLWPTAAQRLARGGVIALRRIVHKTTLLVFVTMTIFNVALFFFGSRVVVTIYGPQYSGSGAVVSVLALSVMAGALALGFDAALYATKRPNAVFHANLLGLGATVVFGFLMARYYGPLGAAYGLLAANVVTTIGKYILFVRLSASNVASPTESNRTRREILQSQALSVLSVED